MKVIKVNNSTIDVFLDLNTSPTGFEQVCWLRLYKNKQTNTWKQLAGIKLPSYKYQTILKGL